MLTHIQAKRGKKINFIGIREKDGKKYAKAYHSEKYNTSVEKLNQLTQQGINFTLAEEKPNLFKRLSEKNGVVELWKTKTYF